MRMSNSYSPSNQNWEDQCGIMTRLLKMPRPEDHSRPDDESSREQQDSSDSMERKIHWSLTHKGGSGRRKINATLSASQLPLHVDVNSLLDKEADAQDKPAKPIDIDDLRKRYEELLQQYRNMPLPLSISDQPMRRVCQVLTDNGLITEDSCDGHGRKIPTIFFHLREKKLLAKLNKTLSRTAHLLNFPWQAERYISWFDSGSKSPPKYILKPTEGEQPIDYEREYDRLLFDLDTIGITLLEHFNSAKK